MTASAVQAELYPFQAKYSVYYKDVKFGNSERLLRRLNNYDYKLTSTASVLLGSGSYENNSWFKLHNGLLTAQRYKHETTVVGFSSVSSGIFDDEGNIVMDYDDNQVQVKLQSHVMDVGAMTILLQNDLKLGKQAFNYQWVFEEKVEAIEFELLQEETINTIFGEMQAVKLKQVTKKNRISYFWFVPKLDYQLAKIEVYKKGKRWAYLKLSDLSFQ
ncbi:MAG: DUF3108 domain-containing protein [Moritella sp.]|uniref:DUF3108 domain-containing protein n=1 Tax=Moritella sp. TaxID=78556 RepID=UPI0029B558FA|nr:DUF3108 domain-containing protein [Moritella sp.]MDX2319138.1 DUF3108 domain-containing protein [Moritella sp.]